MHSASTTAARTAVVRKRREKTNKRQRQDVGGKEERDHPVEKLDPYEWRDAELGEEHEDSLRGK
jgi:hypothetical protein